MTTALIISTYNWPEALRLCLKSVQYQTRLPNELIIADDGSSSETKEIIDEFRKSIKCKIKHVWHPDEGFKLGEIRNKAILESTSEYIVQIDGDIILHSYFMQDHCTFALPNSFIKGRRALIDAEKTALLLKNKSVNISFASPGIKRREHGIRFSLFNTLFKSKEEASADGVMGSNMAFWRKDFDAVNGYNNNLIGWGAEDKELAQRMVNLGCKKRKIKFGAIQFHLYHKESDRTKHDSQIDVVESLKISKKTRCDNGLSEVNNNYIVYE